MLDTLITIAPWAALAFVAGAAANKYAVIWLHSKPAGPLRDLALRVANGGPGHLPK